MADLRNQAQSPDVQAAGRRSRSCAAEGLRRSGSGAVADRNASAADRRGAVGAAGAASRRAHRAAAGSGGRTSAAQARRAPSSCPRDGHGCRCGCGSCWRCAAAAAAAPPGAAAALPRAAPGWGAHRRNQPSVAEPLDGAVPQAAAAAARPGACAEAVARQVAADVPPRGAAGPRRLGGNLGAVARRGPAAAAAPRSAAVRGRCYPFRGTAPALGRVVSTQAGARGARPRSEKSSGRTKPSSFPTGRGQTRSRFCRHSTILSCGAPSRGQEN